MERMSGLTSQPTVSADTSVPDPGFKEPAAQADQPDSQLAQASDVRSTIPAAAADLAGIPMDVKAFTESVQQEITDDNDALIAHKHGSEVGSAKRAGSNPSESLSSGTQPGEEVKVQEAVKEERHQLLCA